MGRRGSSCELNGVESQTSSTIGRPGNHKSIRIELCFALTETWVDRGQIMTRTASNFVSNRVES